jgi:hypothetical protein
MADPDSQMVSLAFSRSDWRLIQEALDTEYYETEHWQPGGLTKTRRDQKTRRREVRMDRLKHLDEAIGKAIGRGPL